jgi:ABC-type dipeptide/oligopeptide/nickel transport systems, permease components
MIGGSDVLAPARTVGTRRGWAGVWRFVTSSWMCSLGVFLVIVDIVLALFGSLLAPHPANALDLNSILHAPSAAHLFGTDNLGRDVLSRVMVGTKFSLFSAIVIILLSVPIGTLLGIVAGLVGGLVDEAIMRVTDLFLAFPAFVLAAAIAAALGPSLAHSILALGIVFWPWYARLARSQVLSLREREFILAARVAGSGTSGIVFRHMLRNVLPVVAIQVSADIGNAILSISALSFLGLGAQPPTPEWGTMMAGAQGFMRSAWWVITFPGLTLTISVLGMNLLGDGLRDWVDPRLRGMLKRSSQ